MRPTDGPSVLYSVLARDLTKKGPKNRVFVILAEIVIEKIRKYSRKR